MRLHKNPENFSLTMPEPTEAQVQASILIYLKFHRRVVWAARFNSGAMIEDPEDGSSNRRYIRFNTLEGCPDILGMLDDGRLIAIEVKRPSWKKPTCKREKDQEAFIALCREHGAVALFARRIEDVATAIAESTIGE